MAYISKCERVVLSQVIATGDSLALATFGNHSILISFCWYLEKELIF